MISKINQWILFMLGTVTNHHRVLMQMKYYKMWYLCLFCQTVHLSSHTYSSMMAEWIFFILGTMIRYNAPLMHVRLNLALQFEYLWPLVHTFCVFDVIAERRIGWFDSYTWYSNHVPCVADACQWDGSLLALLGIFVVALPLLFKPPTSILLPPSLHH